MDPQDNQRSQPTNSDSDATPPSKRRQLCSAGVEADQQPPAASAHPTAMAAAAAVLSTTPVVTASQVPAGHSVSAASRLSPAERCPSDPLSVALSFLDARDFAVASHVCRHWRQAAELQSAWPEFSVERLISGLIQDENHWTQSRSVRVSEYHLGLNALEQVMQSRKWRRLSELHLYAYPYVTVSHNQVAQLPHLQSLRLERVGLANGTAGFGAMGSRLRALHSSHVGRSFQSDLHLLANLRVLVLDQKDEIDCQVLLPLHQLEFLQLRDFDSFSRDLLLAIRRLSVQHRLRHAALLTSRDGTAPDLTLLAAELSGSDGDLAAAGLFSLRLRGRFTEQADRALMCLPALQQLNWLVDRYTADGDSSVGQSPVQSPSPLQKLRLDWKSSDVVALARLLQRVAARAPQLQELSLGEGRLPWGPESLQRMRSLRVLEVSVGALPLSLVRTLAALPLFTQLVVWRHSRRAPPFQLSAEALRCIAESPSWRLIRLIDTLSVPQLTLPNDVDARLAERLGCFRVQVEWRGRTTSHQLTIVADGTVTWLQTAM